MGETGYRVPDHHKQTGGICRHERERAFPLDKVISVDPNLTAVVVSVQGRQKPMAFEVGNPLIAMTIIRIASKIINPSNVAGDKIDIPTLQ